MLLDQAAGAVLGRDAGPQGHETGDALDPDALAGALVAVIVEPVLLIPTDVVDLRGKLLGVRGEAPLVDTNACRAYADQGREGLATRLDKERKGTAP